MENAWGCVNLGKGFSYGIVESRKWRERVGESAKYIKKWRISQALNLADN